MYETLCNSAAWTMGSDQKPANDAAEAIAVEASRLQRLALEHRHHFLAYLLEMVVLEAWREASGEKVGNCGAADPAELQSLSLDN